MTISHIILQGQLSNPNNYKITSGNKWLNEFEHLCMVHKDLEQKLISFVIDWKSGRINRWEHDFEISSDWDLMKVSITYVDEKGHTLLQIRPDEFEFHYRISREGVIKNWKVHKREFLQEFLKNGK